MAKTNSKSVKQKHETVKLRKSKQILYSRISALESQFKSDRSSTSARPKVKIGPIEVQDQFNRRLRPKFILAKQSKKQSTKKSHWKHSQSSTKVKVQFDRSLWRLRPKFKKSKIEQLTQPLELKFKFDRS